MSISLFESEEFSHSIGFNTLNVSYSFFNLDNIHLLVRSFMLSRLGRVDIPNFDPRNPYPSHLQTVAQDFVKEYFGTDSTKSGAPIVNRVIFRHPKLYITLGSTFSFPMVTATYSWSFHSQSNVVYIYERKWVYDNSSTKISNSM